MKRIPIIAALLVAVCAGLDAYVLYSQPWPDGSIVMELQLGSSGTLLDGSTSWGQSAESALAEWNTYLNRVQFRAVRESNAPMADNNGYNNVFFSSSVFGRSFGSGTLAITTSHSRLNARTEADVLFNSAFSWNSYSGPLRRASNGGSLNDLRRVALHEFGHVLGLDHPDDAGQRVSAIMNSAISNIETLQPDDIAGVRALYGGTPAPALTPPGPPGGLATSSSGSSVSLTWNAPSSGGAAAAYIIEAGSAPGLLNLATFSTGSTATAFSTSGVSAGTYYVRVRATNAAGTSIVSNESRLVVGAGGCASAPSAPTNFVLTRNSAGTVSFSWNASAGATTYVIEAGSVPGFANLATADLGSSATSATFGGVGAGTYYVRLRARNSCGTSAGSDDVVVIVGR